MHSHWLRYALALAAYRCPQSHIRLPAMVAARNTIMRIPGAAYIAQSRSRTDCCQSHTAATNMLKQIFPTRILQETAAATFSHSNTDLASQSKSAFRKFELPLPGVSTKEFAGSASPRLQRQAITPDGRTGSRCRPFSARPLIHSDLTLKPPQNTAHQDLIRSFQGRPSPRHSRTQTSAGKLQSLEEQVCSHHLNQSRRSLNVGGQCKTQRTGANMERRDRPCEVDHNETGRNVSQAWPKRNRRHARRGHHNAHNGHQCNTTQAPQQDRQQESPVHQFIQIKFNDGNSGPPACNIPETVNSFQFLRDNGNLITDRRMPQPKLNQKEIDRIVQMAWEDRTTFDAIREQFGLEPGQVIHLMRREMKASSFRMWRKRTAGRKTKHLARRSFIVGRFRCKSQKD